jgi:hypothetical protein
MTGQSASGLSFTQEYQIRRPIPVAAYPISEGEWARLRKRLDLLAQGPAFFGPFGWAMIGAAASAFFAAITLPRALPELPPYVSPFTWAAFVVSALVGIMALLFSHLRGEDKRGIKELIIEDMDAISSRFNSHADTKDSPQPPSAEPPEAAQIPGA